MMYQSFALYRYSALVLSCARTRKPECASDAHAFGRSGRQIDIPQMPHMALVRAGLVAVAALRTC